MFFYEIKGNPFFPAFHFCHQAMRDITFPTTLEHIVETAGASTIQMDWDTSIELELLIGDIPIKEFDSAAQFYNCFMSQLMQVYL